MDIGWDTDSDTDSRIDLDTDSGIDWGTHLDISSHLERLDLGINWCLEGLDLGSGIDSAVMDK